MTNFHITGFRLPKVEEEEILKLRQQIISIIEASSKELGCNPTMSQKLILSRIIGHLYFALGEVDQLLGKSE
jgi:hypothetical protein